MLQAIIGRTWAFVGAVLGAALVVAALAGTSGAGAQEGDLLPLAESGVTSSDIGVNAQSGDVFVLFEFGALLELARFDAVGKPNGRWEVKLYEDTTDVAINARTSDSYAARARDVLEIARFGARLTRELPWNMGMLGRVTDLHVDDWTDEVIVALMDDTIDIYVLSSEGVLKNTWRTGLSDPSAALTMAGDRRLYLGVGDDEGGGTIYVYAATGQRLAEWSIDERPVGLAGGDSDLFVITRTEAAHRGSVYRYAFDGQLLDQWPLGNSPTDVEIGPNNWVYVVTKRSSGVALAVEKFTNDGRKAGDWMAVSRLHLPVVNPQPPLETP